MTVNRQRRVKIFLGLGTLAFALLFFGGWLYFHMIPRQEDLRRLLEQGEAIEIFRFTDDIPVRWVRQEGRGQWQELADSIHFKGTFWQFSRPPKDSIVLQVFVSGRRHLWEVRGDNCLHIRKAVRWYKMPVDPEFEKLLRRLLDEKGEDLDPDEQRKRYSPNFMPLDS